MFLSESEQFGKSERDLLVSHSKNLKFLLSCGQTNSDAFTDFFIEKGCGDGGTPTDPVAIKIDFIHSDNPIPRFGARAVANSYGRAETNLLVSRGGRGNDHCA